MFADSKGAPWDMVGDREGSPMTEWGGQSPPLPAPPPLPESASVELGSAAGFSSLPKSADAASLPLPPPPSPLLPLPGL